MSLLTPEVIKEKVLGMKRRSLKIVRARGEEDIVYGPGSGISHKQIAEGVGLKAEEVAYAGWNRWC